MANRVVSGSAVVEKLALFINNTNDFVLSHGRGSNRGNPLSIKFQRLERTNFSS
jgi:hypothetical protein